MATYKVRGNTHNIVYTYFTTAREQKQQWESYSNELEALQRKALIEYLQKEKRYDDLRREALNYKAGKDAERERREAQQLASMPQSILPVGEDNRKKTYQEFIEKWLPYHARKNRLSPNTFDSYESNLRNHILPVFGKKKVSAITAEDIDNFVDYLARKPCQGAKKNAQKANSVSTLSSSVVKKCYSILTGSLQAAKKWNYISAIPDTSAPAEKSKKRKAWTSEQVMETVNCAKHDKLLWLAIQLAFSGSLRVGETVGISIRAINLIERSVQIQQEVQRVSDKALAEIPNNEILRVFPKQVKTAKTSLILKGPKNEHGVRKIYLPKSLIAIIIERLEEIRENQKFFGIEYHDYDLLLCHPDGRPIEAKPLNKKFQALQADLKIENRIDFYGLRKSGQMHKLRLTNSNVQLVAENGGHTPAVMMGHYNDIYDFEKRALAELVEQSLYPLAAGTTERPITEETRLSEEEKIMQRIQADPAFAKRLMQQIAANARQVG
jgi:Site-specific recombinase XerD